MEETISLRELLETLKKRFRLIFILTTAAVLASGIISYFFLTPIYQASTQLLVNQSKNEQGLYNYNEVQTNLQLINTYNVIIKSPAILELVIEELGLNITVAQLNQRISVQSQQNSQVITLAVEDPNPRQAAEIANTTAEVFKEEIVEIMNVDNVSILAKAAVSDGQSPVKPKPLLNIAITLVVGLMTGVGLAFLLEYFDNTIKSEQDIEKVLGLPVLGAIATIDDAPSEKLKHRSAVRNTRVRGESIGS